MDTLYLTRLAWQQCLCIDLSLYTVAVQFKLYVAILQDGSQFSVFYLDQHFNSGARIVYAVCLYFTCSLRNFKTAGQEQSTAEVILLFSGNLFQCCISYTVLMFHINQQNCVSSSIVLFFPAQFCPGMGFPWRIQRCVWRIHDSSQWRLPTVQRY